jgi:hypothetical protein
MVTFETWPNVLCLFSHVKLALQPTQQIGHNPGTFIDGGGTETAIAT